MALAVTYLFNEANVCDSRLSKCLKADSWRNGAQSETSSATRNRIRGKFFDFSLRLWPRDSLASSKASFNNLFGLAMSSIAETAGRLRRTRPLGFPAALLIACSSWSSHASVIFTGTTQTALTTTLARATAA